MDKIRDMADFDTTKYLALVFSAVSLLLAVMSSFEKREQEIEEDTDE